MRSIQSLKSMPKSFRKKAEAYAVVIAQKMAEARFLKDEAKELIARAKAAKIQPIDSMSGLPLQWMNRELKRIELPHFNFLSNHLQSKIWMIHSLPKQFVKEKTVSEPDKKAIKEAIDAGVEVLGQNQNNKSLIIKWHTHSKSMRQDGSPVKTSWLLMTLFKCLQWFSQNLAHTQRIGLKYWRLALLRLWTNWSQTTSSQAIAFAKTKTWGVLDSRY